MIGDGDHRLLFEQQALVIEDETAVGNANESGTGTLAVEDGGKFFAFDDVGGDAVVLVFFVEVENFGLFLRHRWFSFLLIIVKRNELND